MEKNNQKPHFLLQQTFHVQSHVVMLFQGNPVESFFDHHHITPDKSPGEQALSNLMLSLPNSQI